MGKIFKTVLITTVKVMKLYNIIKFNFKKLFKNEKSGKQS